MGPCTFKACPDGTKMWLLDLGTIDIDANFVLAGGHQNFGTASNPNPKHKRIDLIIYAVLIKHPTAGLILYETGCHDDMEKHWGPMYDVSPRKHYVTKNRLDEQIAATGNSIKDVKAVLMGHLHADHSGGLMHFIDTNVPIYVHDLELRNALWCLYTKADAGPYQASYLSPRLNWHTFDDRVTELFAGITMHLCPGHTPGLCCLQVDLPESGTFLFTGDQFHVKENYTLKIPQGLLGRDKNAWFVSTRYIERLESLIGAKLVYGHDVECFRALKQSPEFYQ
ncbi:hypothetical protein B0A52_01918 [Exophiala mesophila]|uniref:Metallo-beta-lactamase domain-containing protein n=1 Tax=Exophiala mesophila TaxID=212818 RepID=A0A438NED7_EXOME|nr:hypothetical protein B0A52_01918 [Exophiala mesophila]